MAERDPHQEPENSTVDDWHGQEVDRMKEAVESGEATTDEEAREAAKKTD
jgi:hypothetical protein